jgi:hypothetical protein
MYPIVKKWRDTALPFCLTSYGKTMAEQPDNRPWTFGEFATSALTAGLHRAVAHAMGEFCDKMDIMMMGREILVGTDYKGVIPEYQAIR